MLYSVCFSLFTLALSQNYKDDLIVNQPGLDFPTNYDQYSGYLDLSNGHHLHYWLTESQSDPANDPLVLWLNGGPGCSSLDGLSYEHGPWHLNDDGSLYPNDYAWNTNANMLYLEAPIGVGFSYSDDGRYDMNDNTTADDNYYALQAFLTKFPQYQNRDFFITGESYGGVYVPTLTLRVLQGNDNNDGLQINLKGFAVGNGASSNEDLSNSAVWYAYHHGLVDEKTWNQLLNHCCSEPYTRQNCKFAETPEPLCIEAYATVSNMIYGSGLNWYNIYGDCETTTNYYDDNDNRWKKQHNEVRFSHEKYFRDLLNIDKRYSDIIPKLGGNVPCIDSTGANIYFNNLTVQEAIHVNTDLKWEWSICSDILRYSGDYSSMTGVYEEIFNLDSNIWQTTYNGDCDLSCNFLGDEWFLDDLLGIDNANTYRTWFLDNSTQIAGWTRDWNRVAFVTVRGAGHMVPQWRPPEALKMFQYFLQHKPL